MGCALQIFQVHRGMVDFVVCVDNWVAVVKQKVVELIDRKDKCEISCHLQEVGIDVGIVHVLQLFDK